MSSGAIARMSAHLEWNLSDFQRGTVSIENAFKSVIGLAGKMADVVANAGKRMTVGLTLPIAGISALVVKAASDAEELQSAFDHTFGKMSQDMNRWAAESGDAMGRATQEMQEGALAFGQLFKDAAPTEAAAARLSHKFTELAQDAASFYNTDFDTAMGRIRSGLTGEAEPLRAFGVFLNEAAVQSKALEMGLITSGQELDEYGKIMARSALIAEGLVDAQDDIERTSGSLANRIRKIKSDFHELAVEIGEYLEPYAQKLAAIVERLVGWFRSLPEGVKRAAVGFGVFLAALGPLSIALSFIAITLLPLFLVNMGPVMLAISAIVNPIGTVVALLAKFGLSWTAISTALKTVLPLFLRIAGPIGVVITLLQLFGGNIANGLKLFWDRVKEAVGPAAEQLWVAMVNVVEQVRLAFEDLQSSKLGNFLSFVAEKVGLLIEVVLEMAGYLAGFVLSGIITFATNLVDTVGGAIEFVRKLLTGDWSGAWDAAVQTVGRAVIRIGQWVSQLWPWLGGLIEMLGRLTGAEITAPEAPTRYTKITDLRTKGEDGGRNYGTGGAGRSSRSAARGGPKGPSADELAERREAIRLEHEMTLAREKGDLEAIQALERQRDLRDMIERYERAGLSNIEAMLAAERDMQEIDQARMAAREQKLRDLRIETEYRVAELNDDHAHLRYLDREYELEDLITDLRREGYDLATAERIAQASLLQIEEARAQQMQRRLSDQKRAHEMELARLRGDSEDSLRQREEQLRYRDRVEELRRTGLDRVEAEDRARVEGLERGKAHMQGTFRDAFRDGLQSALNGDLKGFFENWMKDRTFKALSDTLDRLADSLANLISGNRNGSGGGGLLGSLFALFGGSKGSSAPTDLLGGTPYGAPGFNTGGRFTVKGFPGIDKNLLSLNGRPIARVSRGEIMNIERGERKAAPKVEKHYHFSGNLMTPEFWQRIQAGDYAAAQQGAQLAGASASFSRSRRLG
jgi:hypothetical protein